MFCSFVDDQIEIFTSWPEPDSGQIVESTARPELEFTRYEVLI